MGGKKAGENTKKVAGNAKKAEAAAQKQAAVDVVKASEEDSEWSKGAKSNAKKEAAAAKAAEAAQKKADKEALLKAEEATQRDKPKGANAKTAQKKTAPSKGTLNLSQLDDDPSSKKGPAALNATGIDSALDALSLTTNGNDMKVDRHPERRFKAAYAAFEARRLPEIEQETPGLRRNQRVELCRKEFEKSDENPFNSALVGQYDMDREEMKNLKKGERERIETHLK